MLRLGIDLGTTRTIVAAGDRGNFPVVGFVRPDGDLVEHYPSVTAVAGGEILHGVLAEAAERDGAPSLRSWKRLLADAAQHEVVRIGDHEIAAADLVTSFLESLRADLRDRSNLGPAALDDEIDCVVSVPANAHSTQRFLTLEGFRRAGFRVRAVLNEPSAAGIEYAHRHAATLNSRREHVVVYDLGGGTFDAALVHIADRRHDITATSGVSRLGGDDFDAQLLAMALERAGKELPEGPRARADLLRECRAVKEAIHPSSRKIVVELAGLGDGAPDAPVVIPAQEYYDRVRPLVEETLGALEPILEVLEASGAGDIAGIYMVGGASGLPCVPRVVRERFGRRVHRSPHPAAATAIGLAIAACAGEGEGDAPVVSERFTRHFGVFREADAGGRVTFDGIFEKGTPMPRSGEAPLVARRVYRAAHNVGHFRFVESGALDDRGDPKGDITPHAEILFPFDRDVKLPEPSAPVPVQRLAGEGPLIEERYEVDAAGVIAVTITDLDHGRGARYVL
jgi:molecular chaperone DnaK (HSP70)